MSSESRIVIGGEGCLLASSLFFFPPLNFLISFLRSSLYFFLYKSSKSLWYFFSYNFIFHSVTFFPAPYLLLKPLPYILSRQKGTFQSAASASRRVVSSCLFRGNPWVLKSGSATLGSVL